ncbi:kinase-like domain-containing protein [Entophlyctis helioformis]|nr:kinase-like domain-containing protein [Entophlyctis helioformis]
MSLGGSGSASSTTTHNRHGSRQGPGPSLPPPPPPPQPASAAAQPIVETSVIYFKNEYPDTVLDPWGEPELRQGKVNQYHILKDIGSGAFGRVVLVRSDQTGRYYACKIISKSRLRKKYRWTHGAGPPGRPSMSSMSSGVSSMTDGRGDDAFMEMIKREVAILKKLSKHHNIVSLVEVLDDAKEDNLYMIFNLCEFGAVMSIQVGQPARPFSEELARKYFRDVVLGLEYLHYKRIIHRDLKPENLLRTAEDVVQIADFGISHMLEDGNEEGLIIAKIASPLFTPPEACASDANVINGKALDIWSLGVTLYCFVHGRCPWEDENPMDLYKKIGLSELMLADTLTDSLKDLLQCMMQKNPRDRILLSQIKVHPWTTNNGREPMLSTDENCVFEDVTEEEVANAFRPAMMFVNKARHPSVHGIHLAWSADTCCALAALSRS